MCTRHKCVRGKLVVVGSSFYRVGSGEHRYSLSHLADPVPIVLCGFWLSNWGPHACTESTSGE